MAGLWWVLVLVGLIVCVLIWAEVDSRIEERRIRRQREIEGELDRRQRELRQAVLRLAEALATENAVASEASRDLMRASYVARGELPPPQS